MLRIDEIQVKKTENSKLNLEAVQKILEGCLRNVASATERAVIQNGQTITVVLQRPISLQTVNKILSFFSKKDIKIVQLNWNGKDTETASRGYLEVSIS